MANTSLDEGDVVRVMRRTVELLSQVPYCEAVSQQLRDTARLTHMKSINRFPVCDLRTSFQRSHDLRQWLPRAE